MKQIYLFLLLLLPFIGIGQTAPNLYYQFNAGSPLTSVTGGPLTVQNGTYAITAGAVGTTLSLPDNTSGFLLAPSLSSSAVTVEFLFKTTHETQRGRNYALVNWGNLEVGFEYPHIYYRTAGSAVNVVLDGINKKSWDNVLDEQWHHMVLVYGGGSKQIWIDGNKISDLLCPTGTISGQPLISGGSNHVKYRGFLDELAFYTSAIPAAQIYQHYLNFQAGQNYQTALAPSVPPSLATTGVIDPTEFAIGHPAVVALPTTQLTTYPTPRYKAGNTLLRNFNWMNPDYMGGQFQSWSTTNLTVGQYGSQINLELAKNWNYNIAIGLPYGGVDPRDTSHIGIANRNPSIPTSLIVLRVQYSPKINDQSLPNDHYLQNASGQFLDVNGNVVTAPNKKWRPTAPVASYISDGNYVYNQINTLTTRGTVPLTRNINIVNDNGELFPHFTDGALATDPVVNAARVASGLTPQAFLARKYAENTVQAYRDIFMAHPICTGAKFTEYAIDGFPQYRLQYSEARKVNNLINSQYYSTGDFYPRWADNWRYWQSAWHGWQWFVESRVNELALGDRLFSPFVAAGWSATEEQNIRPAQWLGLLKPMSALGAEFYYSSFFSLSAPWPDSKNWIWQAATPSYAQAITSRVEEFLRNGEVLEGDRPSKYEVTPFAPGYNFYTGKSNTIVAVRKLNGQEKYYITGTIQPLSNTGYTPKESSVTIQLAGQSLSFKVRRQGSCYVYDKTVTPATFIQLDAWHEDKHYMYWSDDFAFEAEVTDGGTGVVKTDVAGPNYTSFTSSLTGTGQYKFIPRATATYHVYIRAKAPTPTNITTTIGAVSKEICVRNSSWEWVKYDASGTSATFTSLAAVEQTLTVVGTDVDIDKVVVSKNANLYPTIINSCGVAPPPPTCNWVVGAWGSYTVCDADTQYRLRTVVSSLTGCTPVEVRPDTIEIRACTTPVVIAAPTNLVVVSRRWYNIVVTWSYGLSPDSFETEFYRTDENHLRTYLGSARQTGSTTQCCTVRLRWKRSYTFRIRAKVGSNYSEWTEVNFVTQ